MTARFALALAAATTVTAAVSGPLAWQTHQARTDSAPPTTTTAPAPRPNVLGSTTLRETEPSSSEPLPSPRSAPGAPPAADPGD